MFDFCEEYIEMFGCDWNTAMREYYAINYPENYDPEDYEEYAEAC